MGTRKGYDLELKEINDRVETMGKQVLLAIDRTIIALEKMDVVAANAIMKNDALIDAMETDIEERCIQIVVKEQPIASDWRRLASYMRMISDLERIADNCSDIAIYIKKLASLKTVTPPAHLGEAFSSMRQMVADMVEAFHNEDLQLAEKVVKADDIIDELFEKNVQEIRDAIKAVHRQICRADGGPRDRRRVLDFFYHKGRTEHHVHRPLCKGKRRSSSVNANTSDRLDFTGFSRCTAGRVHISDLHSDCIRGKHT